MGKFSRLGNDLYSGKRSVDFVGKMWLWYTISGVIVDQATVQTNIVNLRTQPSGLPAPAFAARLREHGVLTGARDAWTIRMVTHRHISAADVTTAAEAVRTVAAAAATPVA